MPRRELVLGPELSLELRRKTATVRGEPVQLTPTESRLLYALAANLGNTVSTETLLDRGWGDTDDADPSYVWVTMRRLRQKIEPDPDHPVHLVTVRGVGYRLVSRRTRRREAPRTASVRRARTAGERGRPATGRRAPGCPTGAGAAADRARGCRSGRG